MKQVLPGLGQSTKLSPQWVALNPIRHNLTVEGADELYREIRVANTLKDEAGREVQIKESAHLEVTFHAEPSAATLNGLHAAKPEHNISSFISKASCHA